MSRHRKRRFSGNWLSPPDCIQISRLNLISGIAVAPALYSAPPAVASRQATLFGYLMPIVPSKLGESRLVSFDCS